MTLSEQRGVVQMTSRAGGRLAVELRYSSARVDFAKKHRVELLLVPRT